MVDLQEFLKVFVQVTATLIGFAFVTPMVQAISTGLFSRAQTCVDWRVLYGKVFKFISLPLFIFLFPFLSSLSLLIIDDCKFEVAIRILSVVFAWVVARCFFRLTDESPGTKTRLATFVLVVVPVVLFPVFWTAYAVSALCCYWSFVAFTVWMVFAFVTVGVLVLLSNTLTSLEKGFTFKFDDLDEKEYKPQVKKDFENIYKAIQEREAAIKKLEAVRVSPGEEGKWHFIAARYCSELTDMREQYEGPKGERKWGLKQLWEEFIDPPLLNEESPRLHCILRRLYCTQKPQLKYPTLSDIFEFEDRRKRMVEEDLRKFECNTNEINMVVSKTK